MNPSINPLFPVNPQGLDDIARSLLEASPPSPPQGNAPPKKDFIYVPSIGLYVAKEKSHLNKNWNNTWQELKAENKQMLTLHEFREFLKYLKENPNDEHNNIYNEITQVRSPWRSEWIDAYFEQRADGMYVLTNNKSSPQKLDAYLTEDKKLGISLDDWILEKNVNNQGVPQQNIKNASLYYWAPKNGLVAGFLADSDRAVLICYRVPSYSDPSLGVREAQPSGNAAKNQNK